MSPITFGLEGPIHEILCRDQHAWQLEAGFILRNLPQRMERAPDVPPTGIGVHDRVG